MHHTDAITYEIIPPDNVVVLKEGNASWTVDVTTLVRLVAEGSSTNPFTRSPLAEDVMLRVSSYRKCNSVSVVLQNCEFQVDHFRDIGFLLLECLRASGGVSLLSRLCATENVIPLYMFGLFTSVSVLNKVVRVDMVARTMTTCAYESFYAYLSQNNPDLLQFLVRPKGRPRLCDYTRPGY